MGLLDTIMDDDQFRLGLGLLAAGGARGDGMSTGGRIQEAFSGMDAYKKQKMLEQERKEKIALEKQARERAMIDEQALKRAFSPMQGGDAMQNGQGPTLGNAGNLGQMQQFDPRRFFEQNPNASMGALKQAMEMNQAFNPTPKYESYAPGSSVYKMGANGHELAMTVPDKPEKPEKPPTSVQEYLYGQQDPEFNKWTLQGKQASASRTNVINNLPTQESEQSKTYGKGMGDIRLGIQNDGFKAPSKIVALDRMEELLTGVDSGKFAPVGLELARSARSFGIDIDPKTGNKEAAQALAIEMALQMKPPGSGPMTDKDLEAFMNTVPGLAKTPEGRRQITATLKAKAKRDIDIAKNARAYAKRNNGVIDDGFLDEVANYVAANPVVPRQQNPSVIDSILNKYPPRN